ncbi:DNA polymerase 1 [Boothiomyces sp. JEL0866]|nr:DNA polymerase 1 [Boothiomyces sp. JEL0866]
MAGYSEYIKLLDGGWTCITVDVVSDPSVILSYVNVAELTITRRLLRVKLGKGELRIIKFLVYQLEDCSSFQVLPKLSSATPGENASVYPVNLSDQSFLRYASICGMGPFNHPGKEISKDQNINVKLRIIGLDLEQTTLNRNGSFPLPSDPLISAAIVAWDGRKLCRITGGSYRKSVFEADDSYDIGYVDNSMELVEWVFTWIEINEPDFICIHFGFKYDIPRLCAHAYPHRSNYFVHRNLGKLGKGLDLRIPGCTVIDTHWYIDKVHRSEYDSLSLDTIAIKLGLPGKHPSPEMQVDLTSKHDLTEMIYYNIVDSFLHMQVAIDSKCITEVIMLSKNSRSPLSDCSRYITGTISACLMSYFAYTRGQILDWSEDRIKYQKIEGAKVFNPLPGYHKLVTILDFASMYPSVMSSLNLSLETTEVLGDIREFSREYLKLCGFSSANCNNCISWDSEYNYTVVNNFLVRTIKSPTSVTYDALEYLVKLRKELGKNTPAGWTLKVAVNSIYGLYASVVSGLASFAVGASVTLGGRVAITYTEAIASALGFKVIYGDTDSVFLSKVSMLHVSASSFVKILTNVFKFTSLHRMVLEYKETYNGFIIIAKKMYFGRKLSDNNNEEITDYLISQRIDFNNHVAALTKIGLFEAETFQKLVKSEEGDELTVEESVKGLAPQRKDRCCIVRESVLYVCRVIIETQCSSIATRILSRYFSMLNSKLTINIVDPLALVRERRKKGQLYFEYIDSDSNLQLVRKDVFNPLIHKPCAIKSFDEIKSNCDRILTSCKLANIERLISLYDSGRLAF